MPAKGSDTAYYRLGYHTPGLYTESLHLSIQEPIHRVTVGSNYILRLHADLSIRLILYLTYETSCTISLFRHSTDGSEATTFLERSSMQEKIKEKRKERNCMSLQILAPQGILF